MYLTALYNNRLPAVLRAGSVCTFYSHALARRELGYAPKRTFRQAVEEMVRYFADNGLLGSGG